MPSIFCTTCGKGYRVADTAAGKKFQCKQCGASIRVPAITAAAAPQPTSTSASKKAAAPPRTSVSRSPRPEVETGFDALASLESTGVVDDSISFIQPKTVALPSTRSIRVTNKPATAVKRGARIGFRINRIIVILFALGVVVGVIGGREWIVSSGASVTPQEITCADLAANGPGDNVHVRVTDFVSMSNYIWRKKHESQSDWDTVWLPIVPPSAVKLAGHKLGSAKVISKNLIDSGEIHVLIKSHAVKNKEEVATAMHRSSVDGLVVNKIDKLTEKEQDLLHQAYPAMALEKCYIVEDGRQPQAGYGAFMIFGGLVLAGCGVFLMFKPA